MFKVLYLYILDYIMNNMIGCNQHAPSMELFCNYPLFCIYLPLICNFPLLKILVSIQSVSWFGVINSNRMFASANFWDKLFSWFLKILKLSLFYTDNFKTFKNSLGLFIFNRPHKHVITRTNTTLVIRNRKKFWKHRQSQPFTSL